MKVKGLLYKDRIIYYCIACDDFFEIGKHEDEDKVCEHFVNWDVEPIEEDELDCLDEVAKVTIQLNYEVKTQKQEVKL